MEFRLLPGGNIRGEARVPGDKSISHRAVMLGSIAEGTTRVSGFLEGGDTLATLDCFRAMGVGVEGPKNGKLIIHGVGRLGLKAALGPVDLGNSGTSIRLLAGLLAGQPFDTELTGDQSLRGRPMGRVMEPLTAMGATITGRDGKPPLNITAVGGLRGIHYDLPVASAQVKSCVLLAGLYAEGRTSVTEPAPTRDHTERMLRGFGYPVERDGGGVIGLEGGGALKACDIEVPADISSAAFLLVAASIAPDSDLLLRHVGVNPARTGILNILGQMGADIELLNRREVGGEPVADIRVRNAPLKGIDIDRADIPLAIDEFPALFVAAACAEGRTALRGAGELRVKESDRIAAMAAGLAAIGFRAEELEDGIIIDGFGPEGRFAGGEVDSCGDHRVAMSLAVAALRSEGEIAVRDADNVATSFPGFEALARELGLGISAVP